MRGLGHVTYFLIWDPLNISGQTKDRNLKFRALIDFDVCNSKHAKLGEKGAWSTSRDLLLNFGTPSISPERLKLES